RCLIVTGVQTCALPISAVAALGYLRHERIAARAAPCRMEKRVKVIGIPCAQEKQPPRRIRRRPEDLKRRQSHQPGPVPKCKGKRSEEHTSELQSRSDLV